MNGYTIAAIVFTVLAAIFGGIGTWKARHSIKDEIIEKGDENTNKILDSISEKTKSTDRKKSDPKGKKTIIPNENTPLQKRNDYELRKNAIPIFDRTFKIISNYVSQLIKTDEFEDYLHSNTGYGIMENPLRKGHRYGLVNKFYKEVKSMPLNEIIVEDYQYVFKLDGEEYFRISVLKEIDFDDLEELIKKVYLNKFRNELSKK